jgi:hypothetical protein
MRLLDKILGRSKSDHPIPVTMTVATATKIVREYGTALMSETRPGRYVTDVRNLPHRKEYIKQAHILLLRLNTDPKEREALKIGYISLANWQEGVGDRPIGLDMFDLNADPIGLVTQIATHGDILVKWLGVLQDETKALKSELQELGLW